MTQVGTTSSAALWTSGTPLMECQQQPCVLNLTLPPGPGSKIICCTCLYPHVSILDVLAYGMAVAVVRGVWTTLSWSAPGKLGWMLGITSHAAPSTVYQGHLCHLLQHCSGGNGQTWVVTAESPRTFQQMSITQSGSVKTSLPRNPGCSEAFTGCYNSGRTRNDLKAFFYEIVIRALLKIHISDFS